MTEPMVPDTFVREALLQEPTDHKIRCNVCERRCLIIPGGLGWCRTRENRDGRLVTLIYGAVSSLAVNPVEKKPFYHFLPGTDTLTAGSWSCNFACPWCQNWEISRVAPPANGDALMPGQFVALAAAQGCQGTSISFNEPTLSLEWALSVFQLARGQGLHNTYVTNGYMTPEALELLIEAGLDAMNVDIKGGAAAVAKHCKGVRIEKVWAACQSARAHGVHIEITTLVIPGVNDADGELGAIAKQIASLLGPQVPWHVTAYRPAYRFTAPPTPVRTLERAWRIGREAGLEFVYTGNWPGHRYDNTYCPACGTMIIQRLGFDVLRNVLRRGCCPECARPIAGIWAQC